MDTSAVWTLPRLLFLILVALIAPAESHAWASDALQTVRGTIDGETFTTESGNTYPISNQPYALDDYRGRPVQITGAFVGGVFHPNQPPKILVPWSWSLPFLLLLACIACFPFIHKHFWEHHYHHIAIALGLIVVGVYATQLGGYGRHRMFETAREYFAFIALVGSLYVVSGGVLIDLSGRGSPLLNTLLLATGAVIANVVGTTGASALLIRPFLRINKDRLRPFHVVLFIFIVSNCGGALTPIGDPPLFLGYLYGVPFEWTLRHCLPAWGVTVALLLAVFFALDTFAAPKSASSEPTRLRVSGTVNAVCLVVVLGAVFLDKHLAENVSEKFEAVPLGAIVMILAAAAAYKLSKPENLARNEFSFGPIKEVAWLFVGIFATMVPALDYLGVNASALGFKTPGAFYFGSGSLSAILDNAPTYLNFLSAAHGIHGMSLSKETMPLFVAGYPDFLLAISLGSVFFGACTYIGNGPNFMVKAIADNAGAQTPSFFGYIVKYTLPILIPIYTLIWWLFLAHRV